MKWWVLSGLIAFCGSAGASAREGFLENPGLLADYNAELRGGDGRLDVESMIARLTQLRVDTYFYQVLLVSFY